jgi:SAM-dependent methyltransferase
MTPKGGMGPITRVVLDKLYERAAGTPQRLPWHDETPPRLLTQAVGNRGGRGRALDVGCGSGIFSAYLAKQGLQVVGIDRNPEAIAMARAAADREEVEVEFHQTDVLAFQPDEPVDLVFDRGCLHGMNRSGVRAYRGQLLRWLAPGGDFVLSQFDKRHPLDWRPVGPRRRPSRVIERLFAPELELVDKESELTEIPLPIGPKVLGTTYWFRRVG